MWQDWDNALNHTGIPVSCCGPVYGAVNYTICTPDSKTFYNQSCVAAFGSFISDHAYTLGGCALGLAIIQVIEQFCNVFGLTDFVFILQLLGIVFSCYLSRAIKKNYESVWRHCFLKWIIFEKYFLFSYATGIASRS